MLKTSTSLNLPRDIPLAPCQKLLSHPRWHSWSMRASSNGMNPSPHTYLSSFCSGPMPADQLTLVDILSHQTGLAGLDAIWLGADNEINVLKESTFAMCKHLPPLYPPSSKFLYNNWMYALAGEIIERVANVSWGHALDSQVLSLVGLSQSSVIESEIPAGSIALPYAILDKKTKWRISDVQLTDGKLMSPAGGVRSTLHDLLSINGSTSFDELYSLGFAKVTLPAQFGKVGFNPSLLKAMQVIGSDSNHQLVFYHNGAMPGYNHGIMLLPSKQIAIIVLKNSISQGRIADWVAQTLLQTVLELKNKTDLIPLAKETAKEWRSGYHKIAETLKEERMPNTTWPSDKNLIGTYVHSTNAFFFKVVVDGGLLKFSINSNASQSHTLTHYHHDTFSFLPSADERLKRSLFHYGTHAWLLHFKRDEQGDTEKLAWIIVDNIPEGEIFTKL
ncbi:beta-lactamase domain-containing protein [Penicillium malachiteum]|nr:beta-lactamase domain-containing protein [Penicillium malachiteum]